MDEAVRSIANAKLDFGQATGEIVPLTRDLYPALAGLASSALVLFDVVKFEIMRDFQQMVSVLVNGVRFPPGFYKFWGSVSGFFSFCFSCWFNSNASTIANTIYIIECIIAIVIFISFYRLQKRIQPQDSVSGLETVSWNMASSFDKNRIKIFTLILTTLFLPVVRDVAQVLTCDTRFVPNSSQCYKGFHGFEVFIAVLSLLVFAIPTPILFYRIITINMPQPSFFDKEGLPREGGYTDKNYLDDVAASTSPFKSLFEPYERKWAFHKVAVMVMKTLVVLPTAIMVANNEVGHNVGMSSISRLLLFQSIITIFILGVYAFWCWKTKPYLSSRDDMLDTINRFAILFVAVIGLISSQTDSSTIAFDIIAQIISAIAFIAAFVMVVESIGPVQIVIRNFRQQIKLTKHDSTWLVFHDALSLRKARKLRIWHEFWDVLFAQDTEYRLPDQAKNKGEYRPIQLDYKYGNSPPFLLGFQGTICERHRENITICQHESLDSYRADIAAAIDMRHQPDSGLLRDIALITRYICGLDVFWDGVVEAPSNYKLGTNAKTRLTNPSTSSTHFGRAYVVPFPFTVVMVFDDAKEETVFSLSPIVNGVARDQAESMAQLANFVAMNLSPEVMRRRHVRRMLRAMHGSNVYHFYQCTKQKTKTRTRTDSNGKTRTESYTVNVLFTFKNGIFTVAQEDDAEWVDPVTGQKLNVSHGFRPSLCYHDGSGVDYEGKHWTNETHCLSSLELGITHDYRLDVNDPVSVNFVRFLFNNWIKNEPDRLNSLNAVNSLMDRYRAFRLSDFNRKESVMSYAFWYFIYNNDYISQYALTGCLQQCERNPLLQQLPSKHSYDLAMLYQKLAFFDSHPVAGYWFTFWHDFWIWNQDLNAVKAHKAEFDPFNSMSICYTVMSREQLIQRLKATGILGRKSYLGLKAGYINDGILNSLYERLERYARSCNPALAGNQYGQIQITVNEAATPTTQNPRSTDMMLLNEVNIVELYRLAGFSAGSDYDIIPVINGLSFIPINIPFVEDPAPRLS